tara:strand:- start:905 stop:1045 length:141 start_codon:yes stop_codon:yes gene_type:complete
MVLFIVPLTLLLYIINSAYYIIKEALEDHKSEKELKEYQENLRKNS